MPEALWQRVQAMLVDRRVNRLPPERLKGGYVLTELLRWDCGAGMAGTSSREHRYYRCKTRCGRPTIRADLLESAIFDLVRRTLITPDAVKEMVEILNSDIELRPEPRDRRPRADSKAGSEPRAAGCQSATRAANG